MRRICVLVPPLFLLVVVPGRLAAGPTWCASHPDASAMVFCDDWDRDCYPAPPVDPSEACPPDACCGGGLLPPWSPWTRGTLDGIECRTEDELISSAPFSGRANGAQYTGAPLPLFIRNKFGQDYTRIRGTDLTPLVFEYVLDFRRQEAKMSGSNLYMELSDGGGPPLALTDYTLSADCTVCGGGETFKEFDKVSWPILCRQTNTLNQTPPGCGSIETAAILPAVAAGALAYLDDNPCHCGESRDHWSYTSHLAFFDGLRWWTLKAGLFPGGGTGGTIPGDFKLHTRNVDAGGPGPMRVRLTLKSTHCKVELTWVTANNPSVEYSWCEIPLAYVGAFNFATFGCDPSCRVNTNAWTCGGQGLRVSIRQPPTGVTTSVDNIALYGGQGDDAIGACCFQDTTCSEHYQGDCTVLGGHFAGGNTTCANTACCPSLPADSDMDSDVDMSDFSLFQECLSGADVEPATVPCRCYDFDHDDDVDSADFTKFLNCMLGADITANPTCLN